MCVSRKELEMARREPEKYSLDPEEVRSKVRTQESEEEAGPGPLCLREKTGPRLLYLRKEVGPGPLCLREESEAFDPCV